VDTVVGAAAESVVSVVVGKAVDVVVGNVEV
jgi:hypothetical protein